MIALPAISLTDPWASLVVNGDKTLETRKGPLLSGFRGPLVIHRTKAPCAACDLSRWGLSVPARPPGWPEDDAGMALGVVMVNRTWRFRPGTLNLWVHILVRLQRAACFEDIEGRYLSELTEHAWFPRPVAATGAQHRFRVVVPEDYLPPWALRGPS